MQCNVLIGVFWMLRCDKDYGAGDLGCCGVPGEINFGLILNCDRINTPHRLIGRSAWMASVSARPTLLRQTSLPFVSLSCCAIENINTSTDIQAIDTGTTLIYVPDSIAAQFYAIVCSTAFQHTQSIADCAHRFPEQRLQHNTAHVNTHIPLSLD